MRLHHEPTPVLSSHPVPVQHLAVELEPLDQLTSGLLLGGLACFFLKYIL